MSAWVLAGARSQPLVLAIEDLHWADPTSLDLLRALADRGAQAPLLLLATARPEFRPPWSLRSHHSLISLSPLDRAGVARMVGEISASHALSKEVVEGVNQRTGGVPLFVEEVTRLLLERGEQGGVQAIPPTLQQSLAARLDRLGPAREIAQVGAVLGRDFAYALLRDITDFDEAALQASLDRLADTDLLFVEGAPPQASYRFKHALIQDAAYDSLLKSRRQALHRRAAELLRDNPERVAAEPEVIAHHFTQGGLDDLAIEWWGKAGDQALRRSAFQEAIAHLGKAIEMADKSAGATSSKRLKLQTDYGQALMWSKGFSAEETKTAFARATELAAKTDDLSERFAALHGQWALAFVRGEFTSARELSSTILREAEDAGRVIEAGIAHRGLGMICHQIGEFAEARNYCERALEACAPERDQETRERFGDDTGTVAMAFLAMTNWQLGEVERARELIEQANRRAAELGHGPSMTTPLLEEAYLAIMRGDASAALAAAEALEALSRTHGMALFGGWAKLFAAWARGRLHDAAGGAAELRQALAALTDQGAKIFVTFGLGLLAELEAETLGADSALARTNEALALAYQVGQHCDLAYLHRLRGEILLMRDLSNPGPAEEAFQTAVAIARQQGARSWGLRAALSLAKLYQSTNRPAESHAVLVPALEGFAPTPEMPEIVEAQTLLAALAETEEVKAAIAQQQRRGQLQVSYGNALIAARGFGAPETIEAFARARETAQADAPERLAADFGLWAASYQRGDLPSMRRHATGLLAGVAAQPISPETGVAHRVQGATHWFAGEYVEARHHLERSLPLFEPGRDDDLAFRFGIDPSVPTMVHLAFVLWSLGEIDQAVYLVERMNTRIADLTHANTLALGAMHASVFELMRGDGSRARTNAHELVRIVREHDLRLFRAFGEFLEGWATADGGALSDGLEGMRRGAESLREQNSLVFDGLIKIALSEAEAGAGDLERAIATLDEALATAERTGYRAFEAELRRVRGEMLLRRDPADFAEAELAFQTAVAIARQQATRAFELRAALSLAKLYRSTSRPVEAHAVLAAALEGFTPTPEMPQIAEAQTLLAALAETEEVEAAEAQRQRRAHLQTAYGQAVMWSKGYAAEETKAAFARATELSAKTDNFTDRFAAAHGQWSFALVRGELQSARQLASAFLKEAEAAGRAVEVGVARRGLALSCYHAADFPEARIHCERALETGEPELERETQERFQNATGPIVMSFLAVTMWQLGEVERARELIEQAKRRASGLGHGPSMVHPLLWRSHLEILRGDAAAALIAAEALEELGREHGLPYWRKIAELNVAWARGRLHEAAGGAEHLRRALAERVDQDVRFDTWFQTGLLAELEAETLGAEPALVRIDKAMALARRVENRCNLPFLYLLRGKLLLERDPSNPAPAEEALQTAHEIAKQQGARSWGLRAAMSLAKLYQSTARPLDAHAVLAPALEGFSPTPEMPEIAEGQAELAALAETDEVKAAAATRRRRLKLQTDYSRALLWSKGFSAEETSAALADASKLAAGGADFAERFAGYYGAWLGSLSRGDLAQARQVAETFTREARGEAHAPGLARACSCLGVTSFLQGEFAGARTQLEEALRTYDPSWDRDAKLRFWPDAGVLATAYLANVSWLVGEVARARELVEQAVARAIQSEDVRSKVNVYVCRATLEAVCGDAEAVLRAAEILVELSQEYGLAQWLAWGNTFRGWAKARLGGPDVGMKEMKEGIAVLAEQESKLYMPFIQGLLADIENEIGESALSGIDGALALATETGERWSDSFLHRIRGEIPLKLDPANAAAAEQAFRAAIAIAQAQEARSFEMQAALGLAKLYQSTARPDEAYAVLAPTLEGFTPTPEMPEIAEAAALLESLARAGEGAIASRDQATEG
jgi:predicted ATPase